MQIDSQLLLKQFILYFKMLVNLNNTICRTYSVESARQNEATFKKYLLLGLVRIWCRRRQKKFSCMLTVCNRPWQQIGTLTTSSSMGAAPIPDDIINIPLVLNVNYQQFYWVLIVTKF